MWCLRSEFVWNYKILEMCFESEKNVNFVKVVQATISSGKLSLTVLAARDFLIFDQLIKMFMFNVYYVNYPKDSCGAC